jgi:hypothetical protein
VSGVDAATDPAQVIHLELADIAMQMHVEITMHQDKALVA